MSFEGCAKNLLVLFGWSCLDRCFSVWDH